MHLRPLVHLLSTALLTGCVYHRAYEGPPRPRAEVARISVLPFFEGRRFVEPELRLAALDGRPLPRDTRRIEVAPGPHAVVAACGSTGTALGEGLRRELRFEAEAGATYWVVYDDSDVDLMGVLRVEVAEGGEVVADSTPSPAELAFAPLPPAAAGWRPIEAYADPSAGAEVRCVSFVPPHETAASWTRRLELASYGTTGARPALDAVAIDLERCLRTRFQHVFWRVERAAPDLAIHRWRATGGAEGEALDALSVLRAGEHAACVATLAGRGADLDEAELAAWRATLLALEPRPLAEAAR